MLPLVIPSPARFEEDGSEFLLRSGARVAYRAAEVAPIVERFCSEVARRTGLRVVAEPDLTSADASVTIDLARGSELDGLPLDVPYAEPSADPTQDERQHRVGLRFYAPSTLEKSFDWEPADALGSGRAAQVAGVEGAVWAETISDFDDLSFLLLPRLPGIAQRAWGAPGGTWTDHRERLARHASLWAHDHLTYFRSSTIDWP